MEIARVHTLNPFDLLHPEYQYSTFSPPMKTESITWQWLKACRSLYEEEDNQGQPFDDGQAHEYTLLFVISLLLFSFFPRDLTSRCHEITHFKLTLDPPQHLFRD